MRFLAAAVLCAVAIVLAGGGYPVQNLNEGLYARVAQEMLHSGSWIVPTLDGVPYLEKPPLLYWLTTLSFALFGVGEWSARAAPMLGAFITLAAVGAFALRRFGARVAALALLILGSMPLFVGVAHTLLFDGLFTGLLTLAVVLMHEALADGAPRRGVLCSAYAVLALAILTKGLAALVFFGGIALTLTACAVRERRGTVLKALFDPWALALFVLVAVPWHAIAAYREPAFAWFYLWNEHVGRFLDSRWPHDYHTGPLWFYVPRVVGYACPWILLLTLRGPKAMPRAPVLRGLFAAWFWVPFVIFSLAGSKSEYYMIVGMPPLAIVLARRLDGVRRVPLLALLPVAAIVVFGIAVAFAIAKREDHLPSGFLAIAVAACVLAAASAAAFARYRLEPAAVALGAIGIPLAFLYCGFMQTNEPLRSARTLAAAVDALRPAALYLYRDYEGASALAFYLDRPIGIVDTRSRDLLLGIQLRPDAQRFPSVREFLAAEKQGPGALLVVPDWRRKEFRRSPLPVTLERLAHVGAYELYAVPIQHMASGGGDVAPMP
jgi:4-amino-4-deoxy-L-arabinose transferase-like glycosyltransferase